MPNKPYKFFIDADPIAYAGASSAEPAVYYWVHKDEEGNILERSPDIKKAVDAQEWIVSECWDADPAELGWERIAGKADKGLKAALDATDEVWKDYLKTANFFCRENTTPVLKGFLTASGETKTKDVKGLEDRYQGNRTAERPKYLAECREHLLRTYPVTMAKIGWEADTHVVGLAEKAGEDGCTMSIDKDIDQVIGCHHINMNTPFKLREIFFSDGIGSLWVEENAKGKVKQKGNGFKWLCYQAIVGDISDGYKGLYRVGAAKVWQGLIDAETKEDCITFLRGIYEEKAKEGYLCKKMLARDEIPERVPETFQYESWDGVDYKLTVKEMMQQHFMLAYQERSPNDVFDIEQYWV